MKTTKSLFGILTIALVLLFGLSANAQQTTPFSSSLVLDLPLDGSAVDVGPNNFTVITNGGGTWVTNRFLQTNSALSLNGVNQNIEIPYDSRLFPDEFTLSGWFNFQQINLVSSVWEVGNGSSDGYHGFQLQFRGYDFEYQDYTGSTGNAMLSVNLTNLVANTWCQIVVTRTTNSAELFVNGVQLASQTSLTPYAKPQVTPMSLGADNAVSGSGFYLFCPMSLDTIHIYNRALSSNEVTQLYAYEAVPSPSFITNGLVAYYPFNGNANDASGNGNNGNLGPGIGFAADRFGNPNSALFFTNGIAGEMTTTVQQPASNVFTIALWFNLPTDYTNQADLIAMTDTQSGGHTEYDKALNVRQVEGSMTNNLSFYLYPGQPVVLPTPENVSDGQWHHAVATLSSEGMMLYLDGNLVGTNSNTASQGFAGYWRISPGQGFVDDVRIYDLALSSSEVAQLYAYESTPNLPLITGQPQSVTANAYDTVSFYVTASGFIPLTYQWSLNGTNIFGATSSSLTISNVSQSDLGTYTVFVSNPFGNVTSSNAMLSMYPFLAVPFGGVVTDWGKDAILSVQAWGTGPLSYQWFDNGSAILNATNPTLDLSSIQFTNAGLYSVVVSSPLGSVTNTPEQVIVNPAGVSLGMYPGVTVSGVVGYTYIIQSTSDLSNTNSWVPVATLTLEQPVQLWVDINVNASLPGNPQRFYRVLPGQ
jgi:hypothetical protein